MCMKKDVNQRIFQRYEIKYLLSEEQYQRLLERLRAYIVPDEFFQGTVCNIYYDTPDYRIIRNSLEKPAYKEKLRLRSYGVPRADDKVFLEIKKKYKGIVYKRREPMTLTAAQSYMAGGLYDGGKSQILKEIDWFREFYGNPAPAVCLCYDRTAYQFTENEGLRMTFDEKIRWRTEKTELAAGSYGTPLLPAGLYLMEMKIPEAMPIWLVRIFEELSIQQTSFSKYGSVYENNLIKNVTGEGRKKYA